MAEDAQNRRELAPAQIPATRRGPGVAVLAPGSAGEWCREAATRLAVHGFVAQPQATPADASPESVEEAIDALFRLDATDGSRVGVVALGSSGSQALRAANRGARIGVVAWFDPEYDTTGLGDLDPASLETPLLVLCAEKSGDIEEGRATALQADLGREGASAELRVVPGTRPGFLDPVRADVYDATAARSAWDAALARLRGEL